VLVAGVVSDEGVPRHEGDRADRPAARAVYRSWRAGLTPESLHTRVEALEREVQEQRALNRRIAELTDVVTELLLPLHEQDGELADEIIERYRERI